MKYNARIPETDCKATLLELYHCHCLPSSTCKYENEAIKSNTFKDVHFRCKSKFILQWLIKNAIKYTHSIIYSILLKTIYFYKRYFIEC